MGILHFIKTLFENNKNIATAENMKTFLIVGLGNIGEKYNETRHNIGFKILDELAANESISFESEKLGAIAKFRFKGRTFILLKPSTYMNLSGKSVKYWLTKEKLPIEARNANNYKNIADMYDAVLPYKYIRWDLNEPMILGSTYRISFDIASLTEVRALINIWLYNDERSINGSIMRDTHLDNGNFILGAFKRTRNTSSNYMIRLDDELDVVKKDSGYIGKLKSNFYAIIFLNQQASINT